MAQLPIINPHASVDARMASVDVYIKAHGFRSAADVLHQQLCYADGRTEQLLSDWFSDGN